MENHMTYEEMLRKVAEDDGTNSENQATTLLQFLMKANADLRAAVVTDNFNAPTGGTRWAYQQVLGPKPAADNYDADAERILVRDTGIADPIKAAQVCRGYDVINDALWLFVGDYVSNTLNMTGNAATEEAHRIMALARHTTNDK